MSLLKKVLIGILIIVVLLVAAAYAALKTGIFTSKVKEYAKSEIAKLTGKEIDIEKIEIGLINHVTIKNLSIPVKRHEKEGGEFINVDSIIFRFNIVDLFVYKRDIDKTLSHVIVQSPVIHIKKENGKFNIEDFVNSFTFAAGGTTVTADSAPKMSIPVSRVLIENGKVTYEDADRKFLADVSDFKGSVTYRQKSNSVRVYLAGKTESGDKRNLKIDYTYFLSGGSFKAELSFKDAQLKAWLPYALPEKNAAVNGGIFSLDLSAHGSELKPGKFKMKGNFSASNGSLFINGKTPVDGVSMAASLINDRVQVNQADFSVFGGRVSAKGGVRGIFNGLMYEGSLAMHDIDASQVNKDLMEGKIRGTVSVAGGKDAPVINGNIMWETGKLAGLSVKNLEASALFDGKVIELKEVRGSLAGGSIAGSGAIPLKPADKKSKYSGLSVLLGGFHMSEIFRDEGVRGKADLTLKMNGSLETPSGFALITSDKADFNGTPAGNIKAKINITKNMASLDAGFDYADYKALSLAGKLEFKEGQVQITGFSLKDKKQELAGIKGSYFSKAKTFDILSTITGISIPALGIKSLEGRAVEGLLNGSVTVKGTSDAPEIEAVMESSGLKIKSEPQALKARVVYGKDAVKITEFNFSDSAAGTGEFSIKKKIFSLNLGLKDFNGNILKELTGLDIFSNSRINGKAVIKKEKGGFGGAVNVAAAYTKGDYKSVDIEVTGENNEFIVNKIDITQKQGGLKMNGSAKVENDEALSVTIKGNLRDFILNKKAKITADFTDTQVLSVKDGKLETQTRFDMAGIYLNGERQDDLYVTMRSLDKTVPEFTLKMGDKYNVIASLIDDGGPQINLLAELRAADLLPVYALLGMRDKGLSQDTSITGKFELKGALNGNTAFSGSLAQKQGVTNVYGDVAFKKAVVGYTPQKVSLKYNLMNVDINEFARVFGDGFKETGRANGNGILSGKLDSLESGGNLMLTSGRLLDMPYDSINMNYGFKNKIISVSQLKFDYRNTYFTVYDSQFEVKETNSYQATVKTDMKDFVWKGNRLNGGLNFYGRIENFKGLKVDGSLSSENFMFKRHMFQPFVLKTYIDDTGISLKTSVGKSTLDALIKTADDRIVFDRITIDNEAGDRILSAAGFVMTDRGNSEMIISGDGVPPQMANDMLGWDHRWAGDLTGNVKISGNVKEGLGIAIMVTIKNGMVDDLEYDVVSGLVLVKGDWVDLSPVDPIVLVKTDKYTVKVTGKIPAPMSPESEEKMKGVPMNLRAVVKDGDLSMIKFIKFIDDASGPMNLDLNITGTKEFPNVSGKIEVTDASARIKYLFDNLTHVYANILIKDNVIDIYTLKADTGDGKKGTLKIENLDEKKGGTMKWIKPYELNWRVTSVGDKVRISDTPYMEFINGDADLDLAITGLLSDPNISGTMKIYDTRYRYPVKMKDKSGSPASVKDNYAKHINWDVKIYGGENNYFYNDDYVNTYAQVYLKFGDNPIIMQGRANDTKIYGSVGISRGTYKYMSTDFQVDTMKESKVTFDGLMKPTLDVYATTKIRRIPLSNIGGGMDLPGAVGGKVGASEPVDLNINLHAWGRVGDIKMDVSSEPYALNRDRLLYILTFGKDSDKAISADDAAQWGVALANAWIKGQIVNVKKIIPVSDIVVKVGDIQATPEARGNSYTASEGVIRGEIGFGQYITDDIYFNYLARLKEGRSLLDPGTITGLSFEHLIGVDVSINPKNKLVFEGVIRDPIYNLNQFEGKVKIEFGESFDQWGAKPTPTPKPTPGKK